MMTSRAYSDGFRAVGCTTDDDARDNTFTNYTSTNKGVPIYWVNGSKVADHYEDFYDGSWDDEANHKNESGNNGQDISRDTERPWTGCQHNGTESFPDRDETGLSAALGEASVTTGVPNSVVPTSGPIGSNFTVDGRTNRPMYGLSEVFNVIGSPDTLSDLTLEVSPGGESITLSPSFDAHTFTYSATVANEIDEVSLTASKTDSLATVVITGDSDTSTPNNADLDLIVGTNTLTVTVTAVDATTETYTVSLIRARRPRPTCPLRGASSRASLGIGDQFRLIFYSSAKRDALPTSIDDYNTWIQGLAAAGHDDIQAYSRWIQSRGLHRRRRRTRQHQYPVQQRR